MQNERREHARASEALAQLDARREAVQTRRDAIRTQLAKLHLAGTPDADEAAALREEDRRLASEATELEGLRPLIMERVAEARATLDAAAVDELLHSIRKVCGGLAGEHPRFLERAEEAEAKAREARAKAQEAAARCARLHEAAQAVAEITGAEVGEIRSLPGPRGAVALHLGRGNTRRAARHAVQILLDERLLTREAAQAIRDKFAELDGPTEQAIHDAKNQSRIARAREEAEAERERVDAWLSDLLRDGPVARGRIIAAARASEIPLRRDPAQADLEGARSRLRVVPLQRKGDPEKAPWWGLPGRWNKGSFEPVPIGSALPASIVQG